MPTGTPKSEDPNDVLDHRADLEARRQLMAILSRAPHAETTEGQKLERVLREVVGKPHDKYMMKRPKTDRLRDTSKGNGNTGI